MDLCFSGEYLETEQLRKGLVVGGGGLARVHARPGRCAVEGFVAHLVQPVRRSLTRLSLKCYGTLLNVGGRPSLSSWK